MLQTIAHNANGWVRHAIGLAAVLGFAVQTFFGSLLGILASAALLYVCAPHLLGVQPWTLMELALWFDELSNDAKVGIASSLITVLGFFIALHMTMHSWKKQTAAMMRMSAADSIDRVVGETMEILLQVWLFTERAAEEVERVKKTQTPLETASLITVLTEDAIKFRRNRDRILQLEQELLGLPARYAVLFLPLSGVPAALEAIAEQVGAVAKMIWVQAPFLGTAHPQHRQHFLDTVDSARYLALSSASEQARDKIGALHGSIRGALLSPILEPNAIATIRIVRQMLQRGGNERASSR